MRISKTMKFLWARPVKRCEPESEMRNHFLQRTGVTSVSLLISFLFQTITFNTSNERI